jgi:hypothetical protein
MITGWNIRLCEILNPKRFQYEGSKRGREVFLCLLFTALSVLHNTLGTRGICEHFNRLPEIANILLTQSK